MNLACRYENVPFFFGLVGTLHAVTIAGFTFIPACYAIHAQSRFSKEKKNNLKAYSSVVWTAGMVVLCGVIDVDGGETIQLQWISIGEPAPR